MEARSDVRPAETGAPVGVAPSRWRQQGFLRWFAAIVLATGATVLGYLWQSNWPTCDQSLAPKDRAWLVSAQCPVEANAQSRPTSNLGTAPLRSVAFNASGQFGWAVGDSGTILSTLDGGRNWVRRASETARDLWGIAMSADGQRGWAVGGVGTILATSDAGKTWATQASGTDEWFAGVAMSADGKRGWAVGSNGAVLATSDAGKVWTLHASGTRIALYAIAMSEDGQRAWAVGGAGTILATSDAGETWTAQSSGTVEPLFGIAMSADGQRGWAVGGRGTILATSNSGQTWSVQPGDTGQTLVGVAISTDGQRGLVVGYNGKILGTLDAGKTWTRQASGTGARLAGTAMSSDGQRAWAVGYNGTIVATSNAGRAWAQQISGTGQELNGIAMSADGQRGLAVGAYGTILATSDAGRTWLAQASGTRQYLIEIAMSADGQRAWAVGAFGTILVTSDAGSTWTPQISGTVEQLNVIAMSADGQRGWVGGDAGRILATLDAGKTWAPQASGRGREFNGIAMSAEGQRGWVVGGNGTIQATSDAGKTWTTQASGTVQELNGIAMSADGQRSWAAGSSGTILATSDAGKTWVPRASGTGVHLIETAMSADGQRGWVVGGNGTIRATSDAGKTWVPQASGTALDLWGVAMSADGRQGWAVGDDDTILATSDGGAHWVQVGMPYARWPAPAFWMMFGVEVLAFLLAGLRGWRGESSATRLTDLILGRGEADAPVARAEQDKLNFWPVVRALGLFMLHAKTKPPMTFAITAPWGRGKSSLMRMLEKQLRWDQQLTVWFNAWHHQQEPVVMAALLDAVIQQGTPPLWSVQGLRFRTRLAWRRLQRRPFLMAAPFVLWCLCAFVIPVLTAWGGIEMALGVEGIGRWGFAKLADTAQAGLQLLSNSDATEALFAGEWAKFAGQAFGAFDADPLKLVGLLALVGLGLSAYLTVAHLCRPFPARPGALLLSLGSKLSAAQAEEQAGFRQRFREHFGDVVTALRPATLTIFVDDLDRCESKKSAETLEAVNYLNDAGTCFVVLGIAREIVEAQLGEAYASLADQVAALEQSRVTAKSFGEATAEAQKWLLHMRREGDGPFEAELSAPPKAETSNGTAKRFEYARRYLGKLIQIEVPVPRMDEGGLRDLLVSEKDAARYESNDGNRHNMGPAALLQGAQRRSRHEQLLARQKEERWRAWVMRLRALSGVVAGAALMFSVVVLTQSWYAARPDLHANERLKQRQDTMALTQKALDREFAPYKHWLAEQVKLEAASLMREADAATHDALVS